MKSKILRPRTEQISHKRLDVSTPEREEYMYTHSNVWVSILFPAVTGLGEIELKFNITYPPKIDANARQKMTEENIKQILSYNPDEIKMGEVL